MGIHRRGEEPIRPSADLRNLTDRAWAHAWVLDPKTARLAWEARALAARDKLNMARHLELIEWWTCTDLEAQPPRTWEEAAALNTLGIELGKATLGNRIQNLRRAIACYHAALRVRTEAAFPADWAMTQNDLGNAYSRLPTGGPTENRCEAIRCYEAALRVWTETADPHYAAICLRNLGLARKALEELEGNPSD